MKIIMKNELKDSRYYSGYINQRYCILGSDAQKIVCMWDATNGVFLFWEFDGNRKTKSKLNYLCDIDNEIEVGFFPVKEIIPKEVFLIE